jgi:hypothetical protein
VSLVEGCRLRVTLIVGLSMQSHELCILCAAKQG